MIHHAGVAVRRRQRRREFGVARPAQRSPQREPRQHGTPPAAPAPFAWCVASGTRNGSCRSSDPPSFVSSRNTSSRLVVPACVSSSMLPWRSETASIDHDHLVGHLCHLRQHVTGHQHGLPAGRERAQRRPEPPDPVRIETVGRLIEDEHRTDRRAARWPARAAAASLGSTRRPCVPPRPSGRPRPAPPRRGRRRCPMRRRAPAGGPVPSAADGSSGSPVPPPTVWIGRSRLAYGSPSTVAVPSSGATKPRSIRSVVLFPRRSGPRTRSPVPDRPRSSIRRPPASSRTASSVPSRRSRACRSAPDRRSPSSRPSPSPFRRWFVHLDARDVPGERRPAAERFSASSRRRRRRRQEEPGRTSPDS